MATGSAAIPIDSELIDLLRAPGTWTWAYVDVSSDHADPRRSASVQRRNIASTLRAAGAPAAAIATVDAELSRPTRVPAPVARYVLLHSSEMVASEVFPGRLLLAESVGSGRVPDLIPLIAHRPVDLPFIVVEVGRGGGTFRLYRLGHAGSTVAVTVAGRTDALHSVHGTRWIQSHWHRHTEEVWRENERDVAAAIDEAMRQHSPRFIVISGDSRARRILIDALSAEAQSLVSEVSVDARAEDASDAALVAHIDDTLEGVIDAERHAVEERLTEHLRRGDHEAVAGLPEVVEVLRHAQADLIALDPTALGDRNLLTLDRPPWIAELDQADQTTAPTDRVRASAALVRAALLQGATVHLVDAARIPHDAPTGAILRWPEAAH